MRKKEDADLPASGVETSSSRYRPLSALLSQLLVAYTVEFDNEFERQMGEGGYAGARLSLVLWTNLLRFAARGVLSVHELAAQALASDAQIKSELGCLERWRFVVLAPDPADQRPIKTKVHRLSGRELRDGWGSGRGIRAEWTVRLSAKGQKASEIWPPLFGMMERRWEERFSAEAIGGLRQGLEHVAGGLEMELPHGLPHSWEWKQQFPAKAAQGAGPESLSLPTLLSQVLLAFRLEFDRESALPLVLCANTIRVLSEKPTRMADIPLLTGGSPETTDIGWQIKPYVMVEPDPSGKRGKVVTLSRRGLEAQETYHRLTREIEKRWEARFGAEEIARLRESLQEFLSRHNSDGRPLISEGLVAPAGSVRAGDQAPALGRRDVGAAARQRMRDLVAQTEAYVRDPEGALPHYPAWDMNRGFGP